MKISEAQKVYYANRSTLAEQKRNLTKQRDEALKKYQLTGDAAFSEEAATLQLSLEATEESFQKNQEVLDSLATQWVLNVNAEVAKQQSEAAEEMATDMAKVMTVFRRLAKGDIVPQSDEKRLMEYNFKMYQMAKNMQALAQQMEEKERKKHKSLWQDEEENALAEYDPHEKADNAEYTGVLPDIEIPSVSSVEESAE